MKILFITLSNLGDVFLSLPVLDALKEKFPQAEITVMAGPRAGDVFSNSRGYINRFIIYDKYSRLREKIKLFNELKREGFDIVIDLRNSLFGALLPAKYRTSPFLRIPKRLTHLKERNLYRLQKALKSKQPLTAKGSRLPLHKIQDEKYIESLLAGKGIKDTDKIIAVSIAAASTVKLWEAEKFIQLCNMAGHEYTLILIGSANHKALGKYIRDNCPAGVFDFTGLTNLGQLACLLKRSGAVVTCDTGILHMASYLERPIAAIFGPADDNKYGPWSASGARVVKKEVFCRPCEKARCRYQEVKCISLISPDDVLRQIGRIFNPQRRSREKDPGPGNNFKRILVVRTDRIGDVVLTTPVLRELRRNYPYSYIAVMVSPYAEDIVKGNPYVDEVIVYDKAGGKKNRGGFWSFVARLKKKRFDLAIVLHVKKRTNLITFFADIPKRIGYYDKNFGFLLTDKIPDTRGLGLKHEVDYCLDILRNLGLRVEDRQLYMPLRKEALEWADRVLKENAIASNDKVAVIHPGASCVSKRWLKERFVVLANKLFEEYKFKVIVAAYGENDVAVADEITENIRHQALNLAGKTSLPQLAAVLKRADIFISNDSGPVHIASALGTAVISIFGRNQAGLSPVRWGPVGEKDKYLHKEVGCSVCLAHNCKIGFDCLKAITAEDVLKAIDDILKA